MQPEMILDTAMTIAREAGAILLAGFGQPVEIEEKSSAYDWVTQFDKECETLIVNRLVAAFPAHGIIGEEGTNRPGDGRYYWIIDPLDGTTNFAHHYPIFSVSIALYEGATPLLGVVYDPSRDECFYAAAGRGATLRQGARETPLQVSSAAHLGESLLGTGFPYDRQHQKRHNLPEVAAMLPHIQGLRRGGSAALDLAYVAAGRLDGFWEWRLSSWDVAAGALLIVEAGGTVTDIAGDPFQLPSFGTVQTVASIHGSNGHIHQATANILQSV